MCHPYRSTIVSNRDRGNKPMVSDVHSDIPPHDGRAGPGLIAAFSFGWKALALRGVVSIILGIIALAYPFSALFALTLIFAVYTLVDGIFSAISAFRRMGHGRHWGAMLLRGLLGIAVGIIFIVTPIAMTITYALLTVFLIAGWAIIAGGLEIIAAIRLRKEIEGEWLLALSGLLSLLLGLFVLYLALANPHVSVAMLGWGIGFYALVTGVTLLILAMRLRQRVQSFKA